MPSWIEPDGFGVLKRNIIERTSWGVRTGFQVLERKMFHEVKIFDKKGKVKKVLSSKKLSKDYWESFFQMGEPIKNKGKKGGKKIPGVFDFDDENLSSDT
ncbi:MAG: hypothetical protein H8E32_06870 [Nitrospinae bacterium]|nr:hypothetical protein [Nitrospinota bacterium]